MAKDFYTVLGLQRGASDQEIKQAYRKLSRELHPDKHKGDKGKEAQFKEVNEAYEVLSDPKKKANYDRFGSADFSGFGEGGFSGFQGFQGFDGASFSGDLGDLFHNFFAGGRGGRRSDDGRGRTVEVEVSIPFSEAVTGGEREISFRTSVVCSACRGSGNAEGSKTVNCDTCGGTGNVTKAARSIFGTIQQTMICDRCRGNGKIPEKPCASCRGEGRMEERKTVTVRLPPGIDDGQSLRVKGEGEAGRNGAAAGDLLVRVHVASDARFDRQGDDIRSSLQLRVLDAILGAEVSVETVHGPTTVHIPAGTQPEQVLRLKGKGMPVIGTSRHGDHYVTVSVIIPTKLTREEKRLFDELKKASI